MPYKSNHIGTDFDDFLAEEGILEETEAVALKRVISHQLQAAMREKHLTKPQMAKRMHTSRSAIDRLFDPKNESLTLLTLNKAAGVVGKRVKVQFV